jgi:hypothetical protein
MQNVIRDRSANGRVKEVPEAVKRNIPFAPCDLAVRERQFFCGFGVKSGKINRLLSFRTA